MLAYTGGGGSAKGYKIKRFAKGYIFLKYVRICAVWRRRPKGAAESRSGGRRGRRQQRQQAAAGGRTARPRPPACILIYSEKGRRQACSPYRQHGRQSGEAGRAERQSGRRHGRRRSKLVVNNSIIYNYYIYNTFIINTLYCHC